MSPTPDGIPRRHARLPSLPLFGELPTDRGADGLDGDIIRPLPARRRLTFRLCVQPLESSRCLKF